MTEYTHTFTFTLQPDAMWSDSDDVEAMEGYAETVAERMLETLEKNWPTVEFFYELTYTDGSAVDYRNELAEEANPGLTDDVNRVFTNSLY